MTAIPGIYRYGVSIIGQAGHSGTTSMAERQDALVAAADIIQKTSALASEIARDENQHFVATIGKIDVFPNGAAIVPGQVEMTLDLRAVNARARVSFFEAFERACDQAAKTRNCRVTVQQLAAADVATMNGNLMTMLD